MKSPIKGDQEERAHTAGTGPAAAGVPPTRGEAAPKGKGALAGSGADGDYPATAKPGGRRGSAGPPLTGSAAAAGTGQ